MVPVRPGAAVLLPETRVPEEDLRGRPTVGRYLLGRSLGVGGMGSVFRAREAATGRVVAIKVFQPRRAKTADHGGLARRFVREATLAAGLDSPHILRVLDLGQTHDGLLYMVLEYLDGRTLRDELAAAGALDPGRVIHIGGQICAALSVTHAQGLVHRDLKPSNVMLVPRHGDPDFAVLLDFGLVKPPVGWQGSGETTRPGQVLGTPQYAAPEQIVGGGQVDVRADVYAFGILLYAMLAGDAPFKGKVKEVLHAHLVKPPPPIDHPEPDRARREAIEVVARRCLQKDPDHRFATIEEVAGRLGAS